MWDCSVVEVWSTVSFEHVVLIHGRFIQSNEEFYLANVYAPCDNGAKQILWGRLTTQLQRLVGKKVRVCGDFIDVWYVEERWCLPTSYIYLEFTSFYWFIDDNVFVDLPLCGRKYTWYKGDGSSMSHIDRFMLSEE